MMTLTSTMTSNEPEQLVEHFCRHESARLVAVLTRAFGFALIDVVEDMVQEAMVEALRSWRIHGVPQNPAGWLHRVARNRVIDALRRDRTHAEAVENLRIELPDRQSVTFETEEIEDGMLRMIFACCHPSLDRVSQLSLTLKLLCGLGDHEIARGLLTSPAAVKKRVTRAKRHLQLHKISLDFPAPALLNERLDAVHEVLYLMFNEGYSATRGEQPLRIDLCEEAARLCHLLCESEYSCPTTHALLALMLFQAARFDSRIADDGQAILLEDQDRSAWDRDMLQVADSWFQKSRTGDDLSRYHLEAGIARLHCVSPSVDATHWHGILQHYDMLCRLFPSPIYVLNRAIVLGRVDRVDEGISALNGIRDEEAVKDYPLLHCALADLFRKQGKEAAAKQELEKALAKVKSSHERVLIEQRLASIGD